MDTKHCLNMLDESQEGRALRASNELLRQCLDMPLEQTDSIFVVGPACSSWRKCLQQKGKNNEAHMKLILSAAALHEGIGSGSRSEQSSCIHPPSEDPMG